MPRCFQLFKKGSQEPSKFEDVDDAICEHFGVTPDPDTYYQDWYDVIGLALAMGYDWDGIRRVLKSSTEILKIVDFLEEHYSPTAWWEGKGG